jgi:beta-lactamase class A
MSLRFTPFALLAVVAASLAVAPPIAAQAERARETAMRRLLALQFQHQLDSAAAGSPGIVGVAIEDLTSGERFVVNDSITFPQASAIKVALLLELLRQADAGTLSLGERVEVGAGPQVGGDGVLQSFADRGSALSLHDLAILMATLSDNTATNVLITRVGMANVNRLLDGMGLGEIRLRRPMMRPDESARGNENVATPRAAARLMARLARCDLPMSRRACMEARGMLEIPKSGTVSDALPADVPVAWKPGTLDGISTAWALVRLRGRPYVVAVMVSYADARADDVVRSVVRLTHAYFARLAPATPYGVHVPDALLGPTDSLGVRPPR